jgi:hypothetical protein
VKQYIATFFDHWGAVQFRNHAKARQVACTLKPVPRSLSSSCGTCAWYESEGWDIGYKIEELEAVYRHEGAQFVKEM